MNNEEKRNYLILWHQIMMRHHDVTKVDSIPDNLVLKAYRDFLEEFFQFLYPLQPKKLYRYRKFSKQELANLRDGMAWFSHPDQFDDSLDTALNIDLEEEANEVLGPNGDKEFKKQFMVSFVSSLLQTIGIQTNSELVGEAIEATEEEGYEKGILSFFSKYLDESTSRGLSSQVQLQLDAICTGQLHEKVLEWANKFRDSNPRIRAELYELCLTEDGNNDAMWGTYADGCRGFCIQYEIPPDTVAGAMALSNLFPIYYGDKEKIRLVDILMRGPFGLNDEMVIEGIAQSDYQRIHVSSYTKSLIWEFQKEWRVTYGSENLQPFPFATAIILGDKMETVHKEALINLSRVKGLSVFQRKLNKSGSRIVYEKLF